MKEKIRSFMNTKAFHMCMVIIIIAIILFVLGIIILKYNVEGEKNMPFNLNKITVISSSEGVDKESGENKWAFDINQNNDLYLYIEKNSNFGKQEAIKTVLIDNINVTKNSQKGTISFYRPNTLENGGTFSNSDENRVEKIEYEGDMQSSLKDLKIANQGGLVVFRCANEKLAEYISNDEEINHSELLKKSNISEDELKANIKFDVTISTQDGKEYKSNVSLDLPIEGILEKGTTSKEITDLKDVIFKRTKN